MSGYTWARDLCACGHQRLNHGGFTNGRDYGAIYAGECSARLCQCGHFRERCSPAPFSRPRNEFKLNTVHRNETGDTTMSDLTYDQVVTFKNALGWITDQMQDSDSPLTRAELSALTAAEIVARYATRQRAIVAELTALGTMLASPVSATVSSLNANWGRRVAGDRERAERELAKAEHLLEMLVPAAPETTPEA